MVSLVAPSFTSRTVIYALLGWAILAGAAGSRRRFELGHVVSSVAVVALLVANFTVLAAMARGATKEDFRGLVRATAAAASTGIPVLTDGPLMNAFIDVYAPGVRSAAFFTLNGDAFPTGFEPSVLEAGEFWFAYGDFPWMKAVEVRQQITAMGFRRVSQQFFPDALFLDRFIRDTAVPSRRGASRTDRSMPQLALPEPRSNRGVHVRWRACLAVTQPF